MEIGQVIGQYQLLDLIGKGGMGEVFLGQHLQTGQQVAIKTLLKEAIDRDPLQLERIRREGEALGRLNHPNIVKMLEIIQTDQNYGIVLEYVKGGSLHDLLSQNEIVLPLGFVLKVALELADALSRAHYLKIVHRDLKPANILLTEDGTPRLTDFGVARLSSEKTITESGMIVGTPNYISPEMLDEKEVTASADIWAYGVILFEMLTGTRLFDGHNASVVIFKVIAMDIPSLRDYRQDLPDELIALVANLLERDPKVRINSMRKVGAEIENIINIVSEDVKEKEAFPSMLRRHLEGSRFQTPTPYSPTDLQMIREATEKLPKPPTPLSTETRLEEERPTRRADPLTPTPLSNPTAQLPAPSSPTSAGVTLTARAGRPQWLWPALAVAALVILVIGLGVLLSGGSGDSASSDTVEAIPTVVPVVEGEMMILVARLEPIGAEDSTTDRFLSDNLRQTLEQGVPNMALRVREYPAIIRSSEEAQQIAQANQAPIIIWGNYNDEFTELEIQTNDFDADHVDLADDLSEAANVRVRLADVRQTSVAPQVLVGVTLWYTIHSEAFNAANALSSLRDLQVPPAEIIGITVGTHVHRYHQVLFEDTEAALQAIDEAIRLSPSNPILYELRALPLTTLGRSSDAEQASETALRLSNNQLLIPYSQLATLAFGEGDYAQAAEYFGAYLEGKPDDWLMLSVRGVSYYMLGDLESAQADYNAAMALQPQANFPYTYAMLIAIREGRIDEVNDLLTIALTEFPDPTLGNRIVEIFSGAGERGNFFGLVVAAFGNLTLGQYNEAIQNVEAALAIQDDLPELYMMQGLAYCLSGDNAAAETAYSNGIDLDPDFTVLYLLRGDVRTRQNDLAGALTDLTAAQATTQWAGFESYVEAAMSGGDSSLGCESFFQPEL